MGIFNSEANNSFQVDHSNTPYDDVYNANPDMKSGGVWRPMDCTPTSKIALIIPLSGREEQLKIFVKNMISFLKKQKTEFAIFVVEQVS